MNIFIKRTCYCLTMLFVVLFFVGSTYAEESPRVESAPVANDPVAYYTRGFKYDTTGKNDLALADYNHAIEIDPSCVEAYIYRGRFYGRIRQYDLAIADYSSAIEINPNYEEAYVNRGECYSKTGRINLAIADFNQALAINPNYVDAYIKRGELAAVNKQYDLALADLNRAVKVEGNSNIPFALYSRARLLKIMGRYEDSLEDYKHALKNAPHDLIVYSERGSLYEEMKQYDLAIDDYTKQIEIWPIIASGYENRGSAYAKKGQYDLAITDYRKALQLKTTSTTKKIFFNLAQALELNGQQDEAAGYYQEALKNGLEDDWKAKAEARTNGDWKSYKEWI